MFVMLMLPLEAYQVHIKPIYYMAHVTSSKITRCDWLLTWRDVSVMTVDIMKIVNAL